MAVHKITLTGREFEFVELGFDVINWLENNYFCSEERTVELNYTCNYLAQYTNVCIIFNTTESYNFFRLSFTPRFEKYLTEDIEC